MSTAFRINTGPAHWRGGKFRPHGEQTIIGNLDKHDGRKNPAAWRSKDTWAARLSIGLSVGLTPTYTVDDVVAYVRALRKETPDASFILQRGVYTSRKSGEVVEEAAVQIVIVDVWDSDPEAFAQSMVDLADALLVHFQQEEIIVEIQRNGVVQETIGVKP